MTIALQILILVLLLIGIMVCAKGMKIKEGVYKGGFYFFLLSFIANIYSHIMPIFFRRLIDRGVDNPGVWLMNLNIPNLLFTAASIGVLIVFLIKGFNEKLDE